MAKKGKTTPDSVKQKISLANKGKRRTLEQKKKYSQIQKAKWQETEYKTRMLPILRNIAKKRRGRSLTEETKQKISKKNKGRVLTPEWKKKLSLAAKRKYALGYKHPMLGKKVPEHLKKYYSKLFTGKKHTEEAKKKISLSQLGRPSGMLGKHHTQEAKKKIAKAQTGISYISEKGKEKLRTKRLHQIFPQNDSKPEVKTQQILHNIGIKFETHKAILGQPDIFIEPNYCIFVDGDYWHSLPKSIKRDEKVNEELTKKGYKILRIKESEINRNPEDCIKKIRELLKI